MRARHAELGYINIILGLLVILGTGSAILAQPSLRNSVLLAAGVVNIILGIYVITRRRSPQ